MDRDTEPEMKQPGEILPSDVRKVIVGKEEQQEWSPSLDQENPPEPPHIKEEQEQEEVWSSQEGEQLQDITTVPFTPVPVKSEDDEEKPQSSQLHQRQTEHMEPVADGEDCGGPELARNSHPDPHLQRETEDQPDHSSETEDSDDYSKETREPQSVLKSVKIEKTCDTAERPFKCSECGKCFGFNRNLMRHVKIHTGEKPFSCTFCAKRFIENGHVTRHMVIHTGEKPYSCSVCEKRFTWNKQLGKHKCVGPQSSQLHQRQSETGVDGEDCGGPEPARNSHPERPFSCSECGKTYTLKETLRRHMVVHTGEKRYQCSVCEQRFTWYSQLKKHKCFGRKSSELHQNQTDEMEEGADKGPAPARNSRPEKPFSCSECGKQFCLNGNMKIHMRMHKGERPFSCSVCGKIYTQRGHLKRHMAIHAGEKIYSCSVCQQRFTWHIQLRKHKCVGHRSSQLQPNNEENREGIPP